MDNAATAIQRTSVLHRIKMLRPLTKKEKKTIAWVFGIVVLVSLFNFKGALRKARDYQRKYDINRIVDALEIYKEEFGFYPPSSEDGKILGCKKQGVNEEDLIDTKTDVTFEEKLKGIFEECEWGKDSLRDITDLNYPAYIDPLPADPDTQKGVNYFYVSNVSYFQVFGAFEGKSEPEYREGVENRNLMCGKRVCNFGKSLDKVPLEISIQEFLKMESN